MATIWEMQALVGERSEKTKKALYDEMKYHTKQLRKLANGEAPDYEYDNFVSWFYHSDRGAAICKIFKERGETRTDWRVIQPFLNAERAADTLLKKRIWGE